jgi:hypothetical protein
MCGTCYVFLENFETLILIIVSFLIEIVMKSPVNTKELVVIGFALLSIFAIVVLAVIEHLK